MDHEHVLLIISFLVLANALLRKMWTRAHVAFFHPVRCLKYLVLDIEGHVPRAGLSFDDPRACPNIILYNVDVAPLLHKVPSNPRVTLTRERQRSKRWLVPRILNGMSRERACPFIIQDLVQVPSTQQNKANRYACFSLCVFGRFSLGSWVWKLRLGRRGLEAGLFSLCATG